MKTGIVIVNYNDTKGIEKMVLNLEKFDNINKIVIVDNKSNEENVQMLKIIKSKKVKKIYNDKNLGYAGALNIGCEYLIKEYKNVNLILSNSDIFVPDSSVVEKMNECIKNDIGCVMVKVKEDYEYKYGWRLTGPFRDLLNNIPLINRLYRKKSIYYKDSYFEKEKSIVDVIYGCFFMISSDTYKKIDGFDNNTFLYYEEYILARKLKNNNIKSICYNELYVEHQHNKVISKNVSRKEKFNTYKDAQYYYEEKYNKANKFELFMFRLFRKIGNLKK